MSEQTNYFDELNKINVSDKIEKKNGLSYLSWAWAWGELKKKHPTATYKIYENENDWNYFTDGRTCWVKTSVTVENIEHIEYLPVMDYRNASISLERITSFDVNKAIQRSLTKACARHGLGLYVYAGEDLPEEETETQKTALQASKKDKPIKEQTKPKMSIDQASNMPINGIPVRQIYKDNRGQLEQIYNACTPEQKEAIEIVQAFVEQSKTTKNQTQGA